MKRFTLNHIRFLSVLIVFGLPGLLSAGLTSGVDLRTSDTDEPEPRSPELSFVYGEFDLDADENAAMVREDLGIKDGRSGGIERLYWENDSSSEWRAYLDSRYLVNPDELFVTYELHNGYNAFFDFEFSRLDEFDMPGELYYPATESFPLISAEAFKEEISKLKLSLKLMPSDVVKLQIEYGYFERKGKSLSTVYGDDFAYVLGRTPSRGIVPALYEGIERVNAADVSLMRHDGISRAGLRLHYQKRQVERQHIVERSVNESTANRFTTQEVNSDDDLFAFSAFSRTEMSDTLVGSVGLAYTRLDGDLNGSRVFGSNPEAEYDIDFAATQLNDRGYLDLENKRRLRQFVFNANTVYTPSGNVRWMAGLRLEHLATEAFSSYLDTYSTVDYGELEFQNQEALMSSSSEKTADDVSAFLEGRYTGFKHTLFYTRVEGSSQAGDLDEGLQRQELVPNEGSSLDLLDRATGFKRDRAFWELGANFFPMQKLRISVEGYLKYTDNSYDLGRVSQPAEDFTLYPGYIRNQSFFTEDVNARIHCRLIPNVNSVTRVDLQQTVIDSDSGVTPELESSERERFVFNQSLVWTPHPRFYLSGTFNYVEDLTKTGAAELQGTFDGIVVNLPNDYWQTDLNLYYVVSKLIDLQVSYQYLETNQFVAAAPETVSYGMDMEQHHGMAQLLFRFSPRLVANVAFHVYEREEPSAAGLKDYTVHLINGGLQFVF